MGLGRPTKAKPTKAETKKFKNWMLKNYGIQDAQNYAGTQTEEIAIDYANSVKAKALKK
jgi:hypothetical protein